MNRAFQILALALALGMLTFLACRAQSASTPPGDRGNPEAPAGAAPDAGAIDAAPAAPEDYLPASKAGGAFLEHQQAPR